MFYIFTVKFVISNRQLFNAEISFQGVSNRITSLLSDAAVEDFKLNKRFIIID